MAGDSFERDRSCSRAREWASLRADGELSELERLLLRRHLARCASCRTFAEALAETTRVLRSAPLEHPSRPLVPQPRPVRPRRLRYRVALAGAFVLVAAAAGGVVGSVLGGGGAPAPGQTPADIAVRPDPGISEPLERPRTDTVPRNV